MSDCDALRLDMREIAMNPSVVAFLNRLPAFVDLLLVDDHRNSNDDRRKNQSENGTKQLTIANACNPVLDCTQHVKTNECRECGRKLNEEEI